MSFDSAPSATLNPSFTPPLGDAESDDAVDPDGREQKRHACERGHEKRLKSILTHVATHQLVHRTDAVNRLGGIELERRPPDRGGKRCRISGRAHDDVQWKVRVLPMGNVDRASRRLLVPVKTRVADDPYDVVHRFVVLVIDEESLTYRALAGPRLSSHRLVYDQNPRFRSIVTDVHAPPFEQGDMHGFEVTDTRHPDLDSHAASVRSRFALAPKRPVEVDVQLVHRKPGRAARGDDSGQSPYLF